MNPVSLIRYEFMVALCAFGELWGLFMLNV